MLAEAKFQGIMVENVGALQAALNQQPGIHLYGGMGLNVCNHLTVQALAPPLELLTLSPELSARQLAGIVAVFRGRSEAPCLELVVQGSLEVMVAEDCVPCLAGVKPEKGSRAIGERNPQEFWGLQDMRRIFPLRLDDEFRTHIFNSAETCLLDLMPEIISTGLCSIAVDARGRTEEYARRMTAAYRKAIDLTEKGNDNLRQELQGLKEAIVPLTLGGITHGHFVKGLKDEIT
jgi:putative protease